MQQQQQQQQQPNNCARVYTHTTHTCTHTLVGFGAAAFMRPLLQNLALSLGNNEEVCYCLKAWQELPKSVRHGGRPTKDEALLAVAVVNRIRRAISEVCVCARARLRVSDNVVKRIGDVGKAYGQAFGVEAWASELFAEECCGKWGAAVSSRCKRGCESVGVSRGEHWMRAVDVDVYVSAGVSSGYERVGTHVRACACMRWVALIKPLCQCKS
eukprot:1156248-Pelagomonas_calceolata.AAC.17